MQYRLCIYPAFDSQIFNLYQSKRINLSSLLKSLIIAFSQGKSYKINVPSDIYSNKKSEISKKIIISFSLNPSKETEKKAIEMISKIKTGKRTEFFKSLFLNALNFNSFSCFFDSFDNLSIFDKNEVTEELPAKINIKNDKKKENENSQDKTVQDVILKEKNTSSVKNKQQEIKDGEIKDVKTENINNTINEKNVDIDDSEDDSVSIEDSLDFMNDFSNLVEIY